MLARDLATLVTTFPPDRTSSLPAISPSDASSYRLYRSLDKLQPQHNHHRTGASIKFYCCSDMYAALFCWVRASIYKHAGHNLHRETSCQVGRPDPGITRPSGANHGAPLMHGLVASFAAASKFQHQQLHSCLGLILRRVSAVYVLQQMM